MECEYLCNFIQVTYIKQYIMITCNFLSIMHFYIFTTSKDVIIKNKRTSAYYIC